MISSKQKITELIADLSESLKIVKSEPLNPAVRKLERVSKELDYLSRLHPEFPHKEEIKQISSNLVKLAKMIEESQKKIASQIQESQAILSQKIKYAFIFEALKEEVKIEDYQKAYDDLVQLEEFFTRKIEKREKLGKKDEKIMKKSEEMMIAFGKWEEELRKATEEKSQKKKVKFDEKKFEKFLIELKSFLEQ